MQRSTNRKRILSVSGAIVAATAIVVGLGGCSAGGGSDQGGPTDNLEVFSYWTSGSESDALNALIDDFKAKNPGVKVTNAAVAGGGGSNAQAALQARLAGGNPPDTWQAAPLNGVSQYSDAGLLEDLTSLYKKENWSKVIPQDVIDATAVDGKMYGAVTNVHRSNALWYNEKALADAGVDPASLKSFEDVIALNDTFASKDISTLCVGGNGGYGPRVLFENVLFAALGVDDWKQLFAGKISWDDPKVKAAVQTFVGSIAVWNKDSESLAWNDAIQRLGQGSCAFSAMGDWAYGELMNQGFTYEDDFGYVEFPGSADTFLANADLFVVSNKAKNQINAQNWIKTANSAEAQVDFSKYKGSVPVRSDADVSTLTSYQQETAKLFQSEERSYSFQQGAMAPSAYVLAFSDALVQLTNDHDVKTFIATMKSAATE